MVITHPAGTRPALLAASSLQPTHVMSTAQSFWISLPVLQVARGIARQFIPNAEVQPPHTQQAQLTWLGTCHETHMHMCMGTHSATHTSTHGLRQLLYPFITHTCICTHAAHTPSVNIRTDTCSKLHPAQVSTIWSWFRMWLQMSCCNLHVIYIRAACDTIGDAMAMVRQDQGMPHSVQASLQV